MQGNDLATLTAQPHAVRIGDREYEVHPLTLADFGKLQRWVDQQFPDPFDVVARQIARGMLTIDDEGNEVRVPYPRAQQEFLNRTAAELATRPRPKIGSPEADALIWTTEGIKQLALIAIRKGDPSFTAADADRLYEQMGQADITRLVRFSGAEAVISDPKAPTTAGPATSP